MRPGGRGRARVPGRGRARGGQGGAGGQRHALQQTHHRHEVLRGVNLVSNSNGPVNCCNNVVFCQVLLRGWLQLRQACRGFSVRSHPRRGHRQSDAGF